MEIIVGFLIFLLFYWNIFVILKQKGDKMVENYLDDIYKPGVNHCFRLWANGKYGSIYDLENNCVLRFIEVPDGTHYKYKEEDWKQKSPILASGIVVWWLLYRRSKSVLDIYMKVIVRCVWLNIKLEERKMQILGNVTSKTNSLIKNG